MKKRVISILVAMLLSLTFVITAAASFTPVERILPLVVDNADVLTDEQELALTERLEAIGSENSVEIAIVTVTDLEGKTRKVYADDFYDYNGYGYGENDDGMLILYKDGVPGDREVHITTHGKLESNFTYTEIELALDDFEYYVTNGDCYGAFDSFADACQSGIPAEKRPVFLFAIVAVAAGLVLSFIIVTVWSKASVKSVVSKYDAGDYVTNAVLTAQNDSFIYKNVKRTAIPKNNSSGGHISSSGRSHGGGGRSF